VRVVGQSVVVLLVRVGLLVAVHPSVASQDLASFQVNLAVQVLPDDPLRVDRCDGQPQTTVRLARQQVWLDMPNLLADTDH
jgi:hypothetical protein